MMSRSGPRLSSWRLLAYALPAFQTALVQNTAGSVVPTLYATDFGLDLTRVGTAVLISRVLDAFIDPLVGYLSDHTRSRLGRRKPWVIGGSSLMLLAAYQLFIPPVPASFTYFLLWYMAIYIAWSLNEIPHAAWGFEITRDYDERSRLFAFRLTVLLAGSAAFLLLPLLPIFATTAITPATLRWAAYSMLVILPLAVLAAVVCAPPGEAAGAQSFYRIRDIVSVFRGNKPLWLFLAGFLPATFAQGMFGALSFLYFNDYLAVAPYLIYLFISLHAASILFMPIVPAVVARVGKHRAWALSLAVGLTILPCLLLVPQGRSGLPWLFLIFVPIGFSNALSSVAPYSVYGDVVDYDTLKTGQTRAATYSALYALLFKLSIAVGGAVAFMIVGLLGYHPKAANGPAAVYGLKLAFVIAPTLISALAIFFVWRFPLDRHRQTIIKRRLDQIEARRTVAI